MCYFWNHDFTKWKTVKEGILGEQVIWLGKRLGEPVVTGRFIEQKRKCKKCDKVELRTEETTL